MTFNEALATRINELLKEKDMTQYRLAMNSGVVAQSIDNIRRQRNKTNAVNIVFQIAQGFGMTLKEFFDSPLFDIENITD
ncbi:MULTISPECIES: helix-turn-helix domain-containing protein [Pumilibacter]|uniref:helix-turn-helix domain-containing protein n=1 Tax=Pumilibacter TaxID=2941493 RepID=UPI0020421BC2|nr:MULTISPECIES: helix-turn-helix domain-containing protein [Pumilibacter]